MRKTGLYLSILFTGIMVCCSSSAGLDNLKFSKSKKYAIIPFNCVDKDYGVQLSGSLKDWLNAYGYDVSDEKNLRKENPELSVSNEDICKNYSLIFGKIKSIDAVILGNIKLDKSSAVKEASSIGRQIEYIERCDVFVIDVKNGEILDKTAYTANVNAVFSSQMLMDDIAKKIALQLSPR